MIMQPISQSDQGLHHLKIYCLTLYASLFDTLVVCSHAQSEREKGKKEEEGSCLHGWHVTNPILIVNLPAE